MASGEKRLAQMCREHQFASSMVERWRNEYQERGESAFTERVLSDDQVLSNCAAELERFCGQLALENEALKKPCTGSDRRATFDDQTSP